MELMDNKADSDVGKERSPKHKKCFALFYSFYTLNRKKQSSSVLCMDQSRFVEIHYKNLNHNNAVAEATATLAVSPFNSASFFLDLKNFTTTESFITEYPARKALLSWPRDTAVGFLLN